MSVVPIPGELVLVKVEEVTCGYGARAHTPQAVEYIGAPFASWLWIRPEVKGKSGITPAPIALAMPGALRF